MAEKYINIAPTPHKIGQETDDDISETRCNKYFTYTISEKLQFKFN